MALAVGSEGPVATSTSGNAIDDTIPEEAPLSSEDLALLAALQTSTTSTASTAPSTTAPVPFEIRPGEGAFASAEVPKARLDGTLARTMAEALDALPFPFDTMRRYVPADSAVVRGQTGHRVGLILDDVPLASALDSSRETAGWFTVDPWLVDEVRLERPSSLASSSAPSASAGTIAMRTTPAPAEETAGERPVGARAQIAARSADRSTSSHGALSLGTSWGSLRVGGGYEDYRALRVATSELGNDGGAPGYQREAFGARARLLGRSEDLVRADLGFDLDRLLNVVRADLGGSAFMPSFVYRTLDRTQVFASLSAGGPDLGARLIAARQRFGHSLDLTPASSSRTLLDESATTLFGRASLHWSPIAHLVLRLDGIAEVSDAQVPAPITMLNTDAAETRRLTTALSAEYDAPRLHLFGAASVVDLSTRLSPSAPTFDVETTRILAQTQARVMIYGPVAMRGGFSQSAYVPTVRDLVDTGAPLRPETSYTVEVGPSLLTDSIHFEALGYFTRISDAIEPLRYDAPTLTNLGTVQVAGVEILAGASIAGRVRIETAATWSEGRDTATRLAAAVHPHVTLRGSLRYDFVDHGAFAEIHAKLTSNPLLIELEAAPPFVPSITSAAPTSYARVGFTGGLVLGLGFSLRILLENALDGAQRDPQSFVPNPGVDLRAALAYSLE